MNDSTRLVRTFYDKVYNRRNVDFLRAHHHPEVECRGTVTSTHKPTGKPVRFCGMTM